MATARAGAPSWLLCALLTTAALAATLADAASAQALPRQVRQAKARLPTTAKVFKPAEAVIKRMNKRVNAFGAQLAEMQHHNVKAVGKKKAEYELKLRKQLESNHVTERQNRRIGKEIANLQRTNAGLQANATRFMAKSRVIKAQIEALQDNMTFGKEFVDASLAKAEEMAHNSSELAVLAELSAKSEVERAATVHKQRLDAIGGANDLRVSMLQEIAVRASRAHKDHTTTQDSAEELMQSLLSSLADLTREQAASEAKLEESFNATFQAGAKRRTLLLEEQAKLNATKASEIELNSKLQVALEYAKKVHFSLVKKRDALRSFASRLGARPLPRRSHARHNSTVALLQTSAVVQTQKYPFLHVTKIMSRPHKVLAAMNSHATALEESLATLHSQSRSAVAKQRAMYERRLQAQDRDNRATSDANEKLKSEIKAARKSNDELRLTANGLVKANQAKVAELKVLRANLTTAQEFAELAVNEGVAKIHNASEVQILFELADKDAVKKEELAHMNMLDAIAGSDKIALFEVDVRQSPAQQHARDLLSMLASAMDDLNKEQNATLASLEASFEESFKEGETRSMAMHAEQAELNATKSLEIALNRRLDAAVKHLKQVHQSLKQQVKSLQSFVQGLGGRALQDLAPKGNHAPKNRRSHHLRAGSSKAPTPATQEVAAMVPTTAKAAPKETAKASSLNKADDHEALMNVARASDGPPRHESWISWLAR
mmetsp:Transcript_42045/g.116093  ORF Transcript_42045/g.116093 Transcript_42045/m.116093 type:complete len:721 (+) Transcript_42045:68-2230(+)